MINTLRILYHKWILGECRRVCAFCRFRQDCRPGDDDWWIL